MPLKGASSGVSFFENRLDREGGEIGDKIMGGVCTRMSGGDKRESGFKNLWQLCTCLIITPVTDRVRTSI